MGNRISQLPTCLPTQANKWTTSLWSQSDALKMFAIDVHSLSSQAMARHDDVGIIACSTQTREGAL